MPAYEFCLCKMNKLIPVFQFASHFSLIRAFSSHNEMLFAAPLFGCERFPNPLEYADPATSLSGSRRSNNIAASLIIFCSLDGKFACLGIILHRLNLKESLCCGT